MAERSSGSRTRPLDRWARSRRSPSAADDSKIRQLVSEGQPRFRTAIVADARITASFRGEHHEFRSRCDALVQVLRLAWVTDSFLAQLCYRAKVACRTRGIPLLPAVLHRLAITLGQVSIGDKVVMMPGVYLPHGQVVVAGVTFVGSGVVLRPFVTLGLRDGNIFGPHLEERVRVGTGAKLFGPIRVGSGAQIGANAVVNRDVPAGAMAVGVPARVVD